MAKDYVYADFVNHEVPSDEYQSSRRPIIEAAIVRAGARLAALVSDIYGSSSDGLFLQ